MKKILFFAFLLIFINIIEKFYLKMKNIPKISIFLPIYNKEKYLLKSIRSIQSQTLKNIEIIGVNDYSNDNSLYLLKKMSKSDSRIKIVNNDRNHGLLYSRAMGILNSTGEFLMNLDPDDEFYEKNNLEYLYTIAKTYNVDVLNFSYKKRNKILSKCNCTLKIIQFPHLFITAFNKHHKLKDFLIWNKFIKRIILLKAYELFKKKIFSQKWNYHEDHIWSILIYKYAKSMLCLNNIIYKYNSLSDSLMHNSHGSILELKNSLYKIETIKIILNKKKYIKFIFGALSSLINKFNRKSYLLKNIYKIKSKVIKILIFCIKLYVHECPNFLIKKIFNFINMNYINLI